MKEVRSGRRLTLRQLAKLSGLSAGYISQAEGGRVNLSLGSLRKLADALGVQLIELFQSTPLHGAVLRKADRPLLVSDAGVRTHSITRAPVLDLEVGVSEYPPGAVVGDESYTHGDIHEVFVVLKGTFRFRLGEDVFEMYEGDSIDFRSSAPHSVENIGDVTAEGLWVTTPPSGQDQLHGAAEAAR